MPKDRTIIVSKIFAAYPEISHGVSTKLGENVSPPFYNNMSFKVGDNEFNVKQNRDKFFGSLGIDQKSLAIPQQVHSENIQIIIKQGYYPDTDGLITQESGIFLIISTADCYSVLIYDSLKKVIANIHSGWRGTQKKIVTKAVEKMKSGFGCKIENLTVFIGPGISKNHFEVGEDVANMFDDMFINRKNGKYYVDLKADIISQLKKLGIKDSQMEIYPGCTFDEKDYLHSYRRDRDKSGRMFSVIGMRG
jgi:purine-nucleoside/S-methyl-5'-thioadenosine phosphorylase / adenosine deaminase